MSNLIGYITSGGNRIIIRGSQVKHKFCSRSLRKHRTFIQLNCDHDDLIYDHNNLIPEFRKSKFHITSGGKFKARQAAGKYVEQVHERDGEIIFRPICLNYGSAYYKGGWPNKLFSNRINL